MSELEQAQQELARLQQEAADMADTGASTGTDLVTTGDADAIRAQLAARRMAYERQQVLIRAQVEKVKSMATAEQERMKQLARNAERALEPVTAMMKELGEQLKTINLYLGTGERIVPLADGQAAPQDTPITIRQMVLRMDEECAVDPEEGGIDALSIPAFDEWVTASPEHLKQVLPEIKGVVALTPRDPSKSKDHGNPHTNASIAELNKQTYWLIRNGDKLWRTTTDFIVGDRLIPGPQTFTDLFYTSERNWSTHERERKPIRPGSRDWDKAQDAVERSERHFFRVALILEGLIHRTPVLHPLPLQGMSFLDESHHKAGRIRFVLDAEAALGDGHEPFRAWQDRLNAQLRPGMRIVGQFNGYDGFGQHRSEHSYGNTRLHPRGASYPDAGVIYELERVQGGKLGFRYERTDTVFRRYDWVRGYDDSPPKVRASCVVEPKDDWVLPYDLATEEEMLRFLQSRTDRKNYIAMFPLIKAAIRAKRAERELEAPFRTMLAGVLARENGVSVADAEAAIPGLVEWYKTANKWHRPLVHEVVAGHPPEALLTPMGRRRSAQPDEQELARQRARYDRELKRSAEEAGKAVRLIVAEHDRQERMMRRKPVPGLLSELREERYRNAVMVGRRKSDGKYMVVVPERSDENVWAMVVTWGPRKGLESEQRWQLLSKAQVARWQVLWAHERWAQWELDAQASDHLTDAEQQRLLEHVRDAMDDHESKAGRRRKPGHEKGHDEGNSKGKPVLAITDSTREGRRELVAWYVEEDLVLPDDEHPLTGASGHTLSVHGARFRWSRTPEGHVKLHAGGRHWWDSGTYSYGSNLDKLGESRWTDRNEVLWRDRGLIADLKARRAEFDRRSAISRELRSMASPLKRSISNGFVKRWWAQQRAAFVAEHGLANEHLFEGHAKTLVEPGSSTRRGSEEIPIEGLGDLVDRYVEEGLAEGLWDRTVADVLNEAVGRGWLTLEQSEGIDERILGLRFTRPEPDEPEDEETDEEWEIDEEWDAEGTIAPVAELPAGDEIEDAEVVDE